MHHFEFEPLGVEGGGDVLFSSNAHRAAGMVKYRFGFHIISIAYSFCHRSGDVG